MNNRKKILTQEFKSLYQSEPLLWARAPGRVDLMGSHTDYNLGYVMTMAIDRDTWVVAKPRTDQQVRVYSLNLKSGSTFLLDKIVKDEENPWTDYVRGIAKYFLEAGYELKGFDGLIHSIVPFSAGLSSSAALAFLCSKSSIILRCCLTAWSCIVRIRTVVKTHNMTLFLILFMKSIKSVFSEKLITLL